MNGRQKRMGVDLTEGNIFRQLVVFVLPLLLANIVQQLYNTVDMIVIGQFVGSASSAGVSTGGEAASLITFIATSFGSAGQIYVAQLYGAGEHRAVSETLSTALMFTAVFSAVLAGLCILFCEPILRWLNCPGEAFRAARIYMIIVSLGLPFIFGYNMICGILRGMGEARLPLLFVSVAAVFNILMDVLLVAVFPLETAGTAVATVTAQMASFVAAAVFIYLKREQLGLQLGRRFFSVHRRHLAVLLELGIPLAVQSAFIHFTQIVCVSRINAYGLVAAGTSSIGKRIGRLVNIVTNSVNQGSGAMIGQNIGAQNYERVRRIVRTSLLCAGACSLIAIVICLFFPRGCFLLFLRRDDPNFEAIAELGVTFLRINILIFLMVPFQGTFQAVVTGCGNARLAMAGGLLDGVVLRIGISFFMAYTLQMGVVGFFYGDALAHLGPLTIGVVYYLSGRWKTYRLLRGKDR